MTRHLNGVKYPLNQEELQDVINRVETKFAKNFFVPSVKKVAVLVHDSDCRCDACVHAYLEAMDKKSAQTLEDMKVAFGQTDVVEEVSYVS